MINLGRRFFRLNGRLIDLADRFIKQYKQGSTLKDIGVTEIWVDRETGVSYLFHKDGYSGGLTPLLGMDGKPIVTKVKEDDENNF